MHCDILAGLFPAQSLRNTVVGTNMGKIGKSL